MHAEGRRHNLAVTLSLVGLAGAVVLLPQVVHSHYAVSVAVLIGIYAIIALGLSLVMGFAGQVSLGQAAFYGIGAYASAILSTKAHLNPWLGMVAGVLLAVGVAWLIGRPALRLQGHYLAMATLGFGVIVQIVFTEAKGITGGFGGIYSIPSLRIGSLVLRGDALNLYLVWAFVLLTILLAWNLVASRTGRALRAIHDSETAAVACGVDVPRAKLQVFMLSAGLAAVAGSLYAHYIGFISPDPFGLHFSVQLLVMVIVGGARSVWGALLGVVLMTTLGQTIERTDAIKDFSTVVYGVVMVLVVVFVPGGLTELGVRIRRLCTRSRREAADA